MKKERVLAGETCAIESYDGKIRLLIDANFYCAFIEPIAHSSTPGEIREERKANEGCAALVKEAIARNFNGSTLNPAAVDEVVAVYGYERLLDVLAVTVNAKDWDGRFSPRNKAWAKEFGDIPAEYECRVVNTHSVVLDGFIDVFREKYDEALRVFAAKVGEENASAVTVYPDGSISCETLRLVPDDIDEDEMDDMMDDYITIMEKALNLPEGESCTSSGWHAGHSNADKDYLLSDEQRAILT